MDVAQMTQLIGNMGFPIFTAIYFMTYMKKTLDTCTQSMVANTQLMIRIEKFLDDKEKKA